MDRYGNTLGLTLRAWRDRLSAADVGLPVGGRRRALGLRREELAGLARVSVDYLVRLEQGRSSSPSQQVVASLARALHLTVAERDHLYTIAGLLPPGPGTVSSHVPPGVQRMISRLGDVPLAVFAADWTLVSWTPLWSTLFDNPVEQRAAPRNLIETVFLPERPMSPLWLVNSELGEPAVAAALVSDLRIAAAAYPADFQLASLIRRARAESPIFAELWSSGIVQPHLSDRKTISHPLIGHITLDCDILSVPGVDLKLVVYTAAAGTDDAEKLDLLRVVGIRSFAHAEG